MVRVVKRPVNQQSPIRDFTTNYQSHFTKIAPTVRRVTNPDIYHKKINSVFRLNPNRRQNGWRDLSPVDIDVDKYDNPCNRSIQASLRIFTWRIPTLELFQRAEECRLDNSEPEEFDIQCQASPKCDNGKKAVYIWWKNKSVEYSDAINVDGKDALGWEMEEEISTIDRVEFPENEFRETSSGSRQVYANIYYTIKRNYVTNFDYDQGKFRDKLLVNEQEYENKVWFIGGTTRINLGVIGSPGLASAGFARRSYSAFERDNVSSTRDIFKDTSNQGAYPVATINSNRAGISGKTTNPYRTVTSEPISFYYNALGFKTISFQVSSKYRYEIEEENWTALTFCEDGEILSSSCTINPPKPPPPPPPKMRCCPDNSALLREILKIVKQNKKAIGYNDYPVSVPQSLIKTDGREKGDIKLESLTQFLGWYVQRFDEVVGEFEIPIEVEDTDLLKEGNQTVKFKLPNIAEAIAELFLMVMNINITNEVSLNVAMRTLAEAGADKQQNFKSAMMLDSIVEYLGFKYKDESKKLPLTFTPGEEVLTRILQETEVDVSTIEYDDDMNLQRALFELLQSAAVIRAKHWKQVDPKQDIKSQILSSLLQNKDLITQLIKGLNYEELEKQINNINDEQNKA